jgi:hypothetical protein
MAPRTALIFQTHFFDRWCERAYRQIAESCPGNIEPFVVLHLGKGQECPKRLARVPHHIVPTGEVRTPLYPGKSGEPNWHLWLGGHTDLIAMHFMRARPDYDRYWMVEYDVRYTGNWGRMLAELEQEPADLLAPGLLRRTDDPEWYNWPSLQAPIPLADHDTLRAFLPIWRVSAELFRAVDEAYRQGWAGHCEGTWPTIGMAAGLKVADLGGDGEFTPERLRGRFYTNTPRQVHLAPGTLVFKPALYRTGTRRDMLWHPVKPFWWRAEVKEGLRDIKRRGGIVVRGTAAALRAMRPAVPGS